MNFHDTLQQRSASEPRAPHSVPPVADAMRWIETLGRTLHTFGVPAHRLEDVLKLCADKLQLPGQFFATPTSIFVALGPPGTQQVGLLRVEPAAIDLHKLAQADTIVGQLRSNHVSVREATHGLQALARARSYHSSLLTVMGSMMAAATAACFFAGSLADCLVAAFVGVLVGCADAFGTHPRIARLLDPAAALLVTLLAMLSAQWFDVSPYRITVSGLIALIPGLSFTLAIEELASRHWNSGTIRLAGTSTKFLLLVFGVAVGRVIGEGLGLEFDLDHDAALPAAWQWFAVPLSCLAFTILFQAHWRDAGLILAAGIIGFLGARLGSEMMGARLGAFTGAFAVGLVANGYARWAKRPACILLLPGIMLLVPGSVGFEGFTALLDQAIGLGIDAAFRMSLIAISIVAGLLIASLSLPSRQPL